MRAKEFIQERSQLNEIAPLALLAPVLPASLAWIASASLGTVAMWALSAYGAYTTAQEIQNAVKTTGSADPTSWPEELQFDLLGQIVGVALFASMPMLKDKWNSLWKKVPAEMKKDAMKKVMPEIEKAIEKTVNKPAGKSGGGTAGTVPKDPNKIERPYNTEPNTVNKATPQPTTPQPATPKNPNWTEKPYQKEGLVK